MTARRARSRPRLPRSTASLRGSSWRRPARRRRPSRRRRGPRLLERAARRHGARTEAGAAADRVPRDQAHRVRPRRRADRQRRRPGGDRPGPAAREVRTGERPRAARGVGDRCAGVRQPCARSHAAAHDRRQRQEGAGQHAAGGRRSGDRRPHRRDDHGRRQRVPRAQLRGRRLVQRPADPRPDARPEADRSRCLERPDVRRRDPRRLPAAGDRLRDARLAHAPA